MTQNVITMVDETILLRKHLLETEKYHSDRYWVLGIIFTVCSVTSLLKYNINISILVLCLTYYYVIDIGTMFEIKLIFKSTECVVR